MYALSLSSGIRMEGSLKMSTSIWWGVGSLVGFVVALVFVLIVANSGHRNPHGGRAYKE